MTPSDRTLVDPTQAPQDLPAMSRPKKQLKTTLKKLSESFRH